MTINPLIDDVISVMVAAVGKDVLIDVGVETLLAGEKIPIGFFQDCRDLGYHDIKYAIEIELEERHEREKKKQADVRVEETVHAPPSEECGKGHER